MTAGPQADAAASSDGPLPLPWLRAVESVVLFVADIDGAAAWYASLFGVTVQHENPRYAYVQGPGVLIGFHPADAKCPGGVGGTTVYWEVDEAMGLDAAIQTLVARGARLHRGPAVTSFGAGAAMLIDPFGCSIGLNAGTPQSRRLIQSPPVSPPFSAAG